MQYFVADIKRDNQFTLYSAEAYSEPCQASKMKLFVKIVNDFVKRSILGV